MYRLKRIRMSPLSISPLVFGFSKPDDAFLWESLILYATITALGMARRASPRELPFLSWTNFILGACILLSPWMFRVESNRTRICTNMAREGRRRRSRRYESSFRKFWAIGAAAWATVHSLAFRSQCAKSPRGKIRNSVTSFCNGVGSLRGLVHPRTRHADSSQRQGARTFTHPRFHGWTAGSQHA